MSWTFAISTSGADGGSLIGEAIGARSRSISWRLNDAAQCQFVLDGGSTEAALIRELEHDVVVYHDDIVEPTFRGRIGVTQDTLSENVHSVTYTALDYSEILRRRLVFEGDTLLYLNIAQDTIAWSLIEATQARSNGDLGITRGVVPGSPVLRTRRYEPGQYVGKLIDQLAAVNNGFDWEIDGSLQFNVWQPRGVNDGFILDFGGTVRTLSRTKSPGKFANAVRQTGDDALTASIQVAGDIASDPRGRWEENFADYDLKEQATVIARAEYNLAEASKEPISWTVTLRPGVWLPRQSGSWIGDTAKLVIRKGRLDEVLDVRIVEITVRFDESGGENVSMKVEAVA